MKRFISLIIILVVVFSFGAAYAGDYDDPYEFQHGTFLLDVKGITQYSTLPQVLDDLEDQLGYCPDYVYYGHDQVIVFELFNDKVEIPCMEDKLTGTVLVPDFVLPEQVVNSNSLSKLLPTKEDEEEDYYNINGLCLLGCNVELDRDTDKKVSFILQYNDTTKEVSSYSYYEENGKYYISGEDFRQFFYEIYKFLK